ncbi:MAG: aminotransferase class V-fold PLP-dependent enzyme [Acidobacteria bacterium Pan2503]|uniref:Aminotransferase class V-fold PLP-dependent enzyme n=1 Tax=Candidatus Acidiferrum panamense TaxID=2741543 RepID=A0A7V8NRQ8_9BACT|nr:aminotransferase class V-fold PLP-dependent enzyme [Candidatus Acidoferrum panamensis]
MTIKNFWNRRNFLGSAGALAGMMLSARRLFGMRAVIPSPVEEKLTGFGATGNVYEELGVTTVINGQGTMTYLGGSLPRPEVAAVMALAAQHFVSIVELEQAAGKRIAELLKLPPDYDAIVTCGAAAGMQSGLSGILTGNNPKFIEQLPDLTGLKSEVIIQKSHRNGFDHQLRATGVKLIEVDSREDVKRAINSKTAMMHFSNFANAAGQIKVDEWVKLAHENQIPAFNDAAADTPPVSHLWDYVNMGYDLIAFSGGKAIRGPQCAGLLLGKKELIANALLNNSPHEDTLGRGMKIGKEEIVGMVKALECYLSEDHAALDKEWWRRLDSVSAEITRVPGVTTSFNVPDVANHVPHMHIDWDPRKISLAPHDAASALRKGKPSIVLGSSEDGLGMNSFMLKPGEEKIIAEHLVQLFKAHAV